MEAEAEKVGKVVEIGVGCSCEQVPICIEFWSCEGGLTSKFF